MSRQEITSLVFIVLGVVLLLEVLFQADMIFLALRTNHSFYGVTDDTKALIGWFIHIGVLMALCIGLIVKHRTLARKVWGNVSELPVAFGGKLQEWQELAFSVIGLGVMILAIPGILANLLGYLFGPKPHISSVIQFDDSLVAKMFFPVLKFLVGLAVFLGSKAISRLWRKMRDYD